MNSQNCYENGGLIHCGEHCAHCNSSDEDNGCTVYVHCLSENGQGVTDPTGVTGATGEREALRGLLIFMR